MAEQQKALGNAFLKRAPSHKVYQKEEPLVDLNIRSKSKNKLRLTSFINEIAKNSPFGKAVLEEAAAAGYSLTFEPQRGSCGFCDDSRKVIALNPALSDDLLIATLAHESRHAQQFVRGAEPDFGKFNLKCELMSFRAMEADAETAAAATCHEIRVNGGNPGPWNDFSEDSVEIAQGFMAAAKTPDSKVTDAMLKGAFEGWYQDIPMMTSYEEGYIIDVMKYAMKHQEEGSLPYDKSVSSEKLVNMFCSNAEGKCYWADRPDVLNDKDKLSIDPSTYSCAERFFKVREMRTGQKPDATYESLKVRFDSLDGKGTPAKQSAFSIKGVNTGIISANIAAQFSGKKGR